LTRIRKRLAEDDDGGDENVKFGNGNVNFIEKAEGDGEEVIMGA